MNTTSSPPNHHHSAPSQPHHSRNNMNTDAAVTIQTQTSQQSLHSNGSANTASRLRRGYQVRWNFVQTFRQATPTSKFYIVFALVFYLARVISGITTVTLSQLQPHNTDGPEHCREPLLAYIILYMLIISVTMPIKVWLKMFPLPPLLVTMAERRRQQLAQSDSVDSINMSSIPTNVPPTSTGSTTVAAAAASDPAHARTDTDSSELFQDRNVHFIERVEAVLGLFQVFWFFLGMWWLMSAESCSISAPMIFYQTMAFVIVDAVQMLAPLLLLALVIFCLPFVIVILRLLDRLTGGRAMEHLGLVQSRMQPASANVIKRLDTETYHQSQSQIPADNANCVICLGEYVDGELLKYMPTCRHHYHAQCVDQWLHVNNTCPLCVRKVDDEMKKRSASDANV